MIQEADLHEIDTPSPSLGHLGLSGSRSMGQHLPSRASQRFDSSFDSPFVTQQETLNVASASSGVARSSSHPEQLAGQGAVLPEPVKRTFGTHTPVGGAHGLRHSHSAFDFKFDTQPQQEASASTGRTSPFVFGRTDVSSGAASPSVRAARRVTDFAGAQGAGGSPSSRIPRSISRKSTIQPRPSQF